MTDKSVAANEKKVGRSYTPMSFYMDPTVSHPGPLGKNFIRLSDYTIGSAVGFNSSESKKSAPKFTFVFHSSESKKSVAMEKVSRRNSIPDDLSFSILSKLPIKSLKRFECVSKSWSNLFKNSHFNTMYSNHFISSHASHDDHYHTFILTNIFLEEFFDRQNAPYYGSKFQSELRLLDSTLKLNLPPTFKHPGIPICILGNTSVNGIFCFGQKFLDKVQYVLSNPATQEFLVIPPSPIPPSPVELKPHYPQTSYSLEQIFHGFGYDPVRDDFKVIQYVSLLPEDSDFVKPGSFEIYSLKSNSWRTMQMEVDLDHWYFQRSFYGYEVCMDGACHWLVTKYFRDQHVEIAVLSFHLSDEVFLTTPIGEESDPYDRLLTMLNGSIALISNYQNDIVFEISILGELGVSQSWIKLYTCGPLPFIEWPPIAFGKKGYMFFLKKDELVDDHELVYNELADGEVAYVDLSSHIIKEVGITLRYRSKFAVGLYKESLLSIGGSSNQCYQISAKWPIYMAVYGIGAMLFVRYCRFFRHNPQ